MSTVSKGDLILVTGVNGYIASHVADQLLEAGFSVRGTTRSKDKVGWMFDLFDKKYGEGKFEAVEVPDMVQLGAFDDAVKGVAGICHVASILTFSNKVDEVIAPTVKGVLNILTAASKEPSVKSVVYTSSSTAAVLAPPNKKLVITEDTWTDSIVESVTKDPNPDSYQVYAASKAEAEHAFWNAVKETNPPFQAAAVLPAANIGTIFRPGGELSSSTGSWIPKLIQGDASPLSTLPQYYIDVRDSGRLHVAALVDPSCNGRRIFGFARPYTWNKILGILRNQNPSKTFPDDTESGEDLSEVPNAEAEELLRKHYGKGWTSLEESIADNTASLKP